MTINDITPTSEAVAGLTAAFNTDKVNLVCKGKTTANL